MCLNVDTPARVRHLRSWPLSVATGMITISGCAGSSEGLERTVFEAWGREKRLPETMVDCMFGQLTEMMDEGATADGGRVMSVVLDCGGAPSDVADCVVTTTVDLIGSLDAAEFDLAIERLGASDVRKLAIGVTKCRGYSDAEAVCAIDGLAAEYGSAVLQSLRKQLTGDQQVRLEELLAECVEAELSDAGGEGSASDPATTTLLPRADNDNGSAAEADMCRAVGDAIAFGGPDDADAAAIVNALEVAIDGLRRAASNADADKRPGLNDAAAFYETLVPTFVAIDEERSEFEGTEAVAADALVEAAVPLLREHSLMMVAANAVEDCGFAVDPTALDDFIAAARNFLLVEEAQRPAYGALHEMVDVMDDVTARNNGQPTAGLVDAYEQCSAAPAAKQPGDNAGCDELYDACGGDNLLACNDLYWISVIGSEYERFSAACGDRTRFGRDGYGGFCDELDDS